MKRKSIVYAVASLALAYVGANAHAARPASDFGVLDPTAKVLASTVKGEREVAILEFTEEQVPALMLVVSDAAQALSREGTRDRASALDELGFAELAALAYEGVSGESLPPGAERRMLEIEAVIKRQPQPVVGWGVETSPQAPRSICPKTSVTNGFKYDCKVYGNVVKSETSTTDVCLMTTAIIGSHTLDLSYKNVWGNYKSNATVGVAQGQTRAVLVQSVKRTRRGQIYNANVNEYSRFAFNGYWTSALNTHGPTPCELFIIHNS